METNNDIDILDDEAIHYVPASQGKRFANYLIDLVFFYLIFFLIAILLVIINPSIFDGLTDDDSVASSLFDRILTLVMYGLFMGIVEGIFKGKTLGKLITGTRAIQNDGTVLTFSKALTRGFSRMVPFNPFSALGSPCYPWHDSWTDTAVIDEKQSHYK